jgi:hypothetical protein
LVTAFTFYIGHTRSKKSEQVRINRELLDRIESQEEIFETISTADLGSNADNRARMIKTINSLRNELNYFVYLTEKGGIKDSIVTEYYRKRLLPIYRTAKFIEKKYPGTGEYSGTGKIVDLIEKYHQITHKTKKYEAEFVNL